MATYRVKLKKRPSSSIVSMTFPSYNEAIAFCRKATLLNPSRPFKQGLDWKVAIVKPSTEKPEYDVEKVADWQKPGLFYDNWKGLEGLYHLPVGEHVAPQKQAA
jgi:hypothetical protein